MIWCREARLLCLFRFKIWWMIPRVGNSAMDIPIETQMLLLEAREEQHSEKDEGNTAYVLFLPILNDVFRSSLQGNSANELEVCVETGNIFWSFQIFLQTSITHLNIEWYKETANIYMERKSIKCSH